jgi:hypothetical protein
LSLSKSDGRAAFIRTLRENEDIEPIRFELEYHLAAFVRFRDRLDVAGRLDWRVRLGARRSERDNRPVDQAEQNNGRKQKAKHSKAGKAKHNASSLGIDLGSNRSQNA